MNRFRRSFAKPAVSFSLAALSLASISAAELIYQEDFETDGEAANPQRYTTVGRDVYEIPRIRSELGNQDQLGPIYFAHNNEVSFVGVPAPTAARRIAMAWDLTITSAEASPAMLELFDSSMRWLLNNRANARIVVNPAGTSLGVLGERLTAAGHTLVDDDTTVPDEQLTTLGDMLIHGPAGGSRGARAAFPMLVIASADHDDVLTSSIGTPTTFEAGKGRIKAAGHPAAGGKTGEFDVATGSFNWQLLGEILPGGSTLLASFDQPVQSTIASLDDVEAIIVGTKPGTATTGQSAILDINDATEGNWAGGEAVPGGATGIWGILATGQLNVSPAGTFTLASGADDGVRVQIDLNKNGIFETSETIINDVGPHAPTITYGNVTFPAAGAYNLRVVGYNSGAGGSLELSVGVAAGGGQTGLDTNPENWEVLGTTGAVSPVKIQGNFQLTGYVPAGTVQTVEQPLLVLLNGPNDTPPGAVFGGGPFTGQSGSRFVAGAGMNKWTVPDTGDRYLTLRPVNVAGKQNVKLTIALAGTFLDFERSNLTRGGADYIEVAIDPDAGGPSPFERLMFFTAPSGTIKYVDDATTRPSNPTRLGLQFKDVSYDIPAGATDLIVEVRAISTFWNEIFAFDNIRITAGANDVLPTLSIAKQGNNVVLTFANGTLQRTATLDSNPAQTVWTDVIATGTHAVTPAQQGAAEFFRVRRPN